MTHITTDQNEEPIIRLAYNLGVEVRFFAVSEIVLCAIVQDVIETSSGLN